MKLRLKRLTIILLVISIISVTACTREELKDVNEVFNDFEVNYLIINHELANYYKGYDESLTDNSELIQLIENENISYYDNLRKSLEYLNKYKTSELEEVDRVTMETMKWYLQIEIEGEKYRNYNFSTNDWTGTGIDLGSYLLNNYKIENKADAEGYLEFLSKLNNHFDRIIEDLQEGENQGIIPSRKSIDEFIYDSSLLTRRNIQFSDFYKKFKNKVEKLSDIDEKEKEELIKRAEEEIVITVYPAYERLKKYALELRKKSSETSGPIWKYKNGDEYYEYLFKKTTSTNYTPEEVHEMALKEVERIKEEIMKILMENEEYKDLSFEEFIDLEAETYSVEV
ncbi:DUF885 family protein [Alkaliphilus serpentinus]|nr:DUF885 family protein [Alkaliphilus serpentinus]